MKSLAVRLAVALVTFALGVCLAALTPGRHAPRPVVSQFVAYEVEVMDLSAPPRRGECVNARIAETPEEKAVRLAEEFIARNGYTDLPHDRHSLSYESIEWGRDIDETLRLRHDSLERKVYGIFYSGKGRAPGWTVVFRHSGRYGNHYDETGRAVTMDKNFENLRVEHKSFFLRKVEKKF